MFLIVSVSIQQHNNTTTIRLASCNVVESSPSLCPLSADYLAFDSWPRPAHTPLYVCQSLCCVFGLMDHGRVETEQRTAAAERKVALLTERAAHLEQLVNQMNSQTHNPLTHSRNERRASLHCASLPLRHSHSALVVMIANIALDTAAPTVPSSSTSSSLPPSSVPFLLSQLQSLRAALAADEEEKRKLQEENTKLKYRINILLRSLDEEERKHTTHSTSSHSSSDNSSSGGGSVGQHSVSEVKQVLDKLAA